MFQVVKKKKHQQDIFCSFVHMFYYDNMRPNNDDTNVVCVSKYLFVCVRWCIYIYIPPKKSRGRSEVTPTFTFT